MHYFDYMTCGLFILFPFLHFPSLFLLKFHEAYKQFKHDFSNYVVHC